MIKEPNSVRDFDEFWRWKSNVEDESRRDVIPEFQCCVVLVTMTDGILSKYGVTVFTRPGTGSWTITAWKNDKNIILLLEWKDDDGSRRE